jgi:hypothetical protein
VNDDLLPLRIPGEPEVRTLRHGLTAIYIIDPEARARRMPKAMPMPRAEPALCGQPTASGRPCATVRTSAPGTKPLQRSNAS